MSIPYIHDIMDYSYVNKLIKSFNSKLFKVAKGFNHVSIIEIVNNRFLFTKHGFHLNELGKELLSNQLVSHILLILEEDRSKPIILGWYGKNPQVNDSLIVKFAHTHINSQSEKDQIPKRSRKVPITGNDDFLWEI
jgi:hypothetical protein